MRTRAKAVPQGRALNQIKQGLVSNTRGFCPALSGPLW